VLLVPRANLSSKEDTSLLQEGSLEKAAFENINKCNKEGGNSKKEPSRAKRRGMKLV
jgi:hypothetical protein